MPFCTACGRQNPDDARFCSQCGTRLVTPDAPAEPSRGETTATISLGAGDSRVETSDRLAPARGLRPGRLDLHGLGRGQPQRHLRQP